MGSVEWGSVLFLESQDLCCLKFEIYDMLTLLHFLFIFFQSMAVSSLLGKMVLSPNDIEERDLDLPLPGNVNCHNSCHL